MKCVEIVHMRSSPDGRERNIAQLAEHLQHSAGTEHLAGVLVLKHLFYPGDLAVALMWDQARQPIRSREAVALADVMSESGSVEHSVWEVVSHFAPTEAGMRPQDPPLSPG